MYETLTVDIQDHIAKVCLNRPDKMNAINPAMFADISALCERLKSDRSVRVVVLHGAGKAFCAGIDVASLAGGMSFEEGCTGSYPNLFQQPCYLWKSIPVPVICAVHGVAFGGGLQIALGADIRIAHPATRLSVMEIKWGLIPDMSASQTLRDLVSLDVAKELTFTGRLVEAPEALEIGLVTRLSDSPEDAAMDMARQIARRSPDAIAYAKYLYENSWHGSPEEGLKMEERLQAQIIGAQNQMEAVRSEMAGEEADYAERQFVDFDDVEARLRS